jgi:hypothetical protein
VIPHEAVGCPIRRSEDQRALAPPLGFSQRATSFIASRCQGIHQMPFMCRARAQPQARALARAWQRSDLRGQRSDQQAGTPEPSSDLRSLSPISGRRHSPADARASAHAYPCPGPISSHKDDDRTCFTVTTRFTISKGRDQRSEIRGRIANAPARAARFRHRLRHPILSNAIPMTRMPDDERRPTCGRTASERWPDTV